MAFLLIEVFLIEKYRRREGAETAQEVAI